MTTPDHAAVQIVRKASPGLTRLGAIAAVAALARAGWLHDPARIAALEKVAEAVRRMRAVDRGVPHYGPVMEVYAALDTLPAAAASSPADDGRERER